MDTLYQAKQTPSYGGKINHLLDLRQLNLPVPNGLILSAEQVMTWLADCWLRISKPKTRLGQVAQVRSKSGARKVRKSESAC